MRGMKYLYYWHDATTDLKEFWNSSELENINKNVKSDKKEIVVGSCGDLSVPLIIPTNI